MNYNEVFVETKDNNNNNIEIKPEYVYLTIPAKYVCIYHKLLVYLADYGKNIIDNCNEGCKGDSKNILYCWNLFQSAIACYTLGDERKADFFINYIKKQLELNYRGSNKKVFNSTVPLSITKDGYLKAVVTCCDDTKFYVDKETGELYQKYNNEELDNKVYTIENDNLIARNNE